MTLPTILTFNYWFSLYPLPLMPVLATGLLFVMLAILCLGIGLMIYARLAKGLTKPLRRAWRLFGTIVLWAGIVGLYVYAMTWQVVPLLGMRIWFVVWFVLFAWLIRGALCRLFTDIPAGQEADRVRSSYEKWLPKPKK